MCTKTHFEHKATDGIHFKSPKVTGIILHNLSNASFAMWKWLAHISASGDIAKMNTKTFSCTHTKNCIAHTCRQLSLHLHTCTSQYSYFELSFEYIVLFLLWRSLFPTTTGWSVGTSDKCKIRSWLLSNSKWLNCRILVVWPSSPSQRFFL